MPRTLASNSLTVPELKKAIKDGLIALSAGKKPPEKIACGYGLQLWLMGSGVDYGYWRLPYRFAGKQKLLALGVCDLAKLDLADARKKAQAVKKTIEQGIDPSIERKEAKQEAMNAAANSFEAVAIEWHSKQAPKWDESHATAVLRTMEKDLFPIIGQRHIEDLKTKDLLYPLRVVEKRGALELAARLRQRITCVMRYAVQTGRIDHNPANDLDGALTVAKTEHRPAVPLEQIPELIQRIHAHSGRYVTKAAMLFVMHTFCRSSETRMARWSEFDLDAGLWVLPAKREAVEGVKHSTRGAKMKTVHLVPLSSQVVALLRELHTVTGRFDYVFAGDHDAAKPMSDGTVNKALKAMGYDTKTQMCQHGFRTLACSSMVESRLWDKDAVERQMSHQERNSVRAAYIHKAEHIAQRTQMMQWWADYLEANAKGKYIAPDAFEVQSVSKVIPLPRKTA